MSHPPPGHSATVPTNGGVQGEPIDVLFVEDNPGDIRLTVEAFRQARVGNDFHVVGRVEEAMDYLHQRGEHAEADRPDLVLLDLNLPGTDGIGMLEEVKSHPDLKPIPVIVLTSSTAEEDIVDSYGNHANAYLTKPVDADEFVDLARSFSEFWVETVELPKPSE